MMFDEPVFVGIDPTAGDRPMHFAVLNRDLRLVALSRGDAETVLAFVGGLKQAAIAIDAPQSPNRGLMLRPEFRRRYNLQPEGRTWGQWKVCEYELRRRNIRLYNTPRKEEEAPRWMRIGFSLYRRMLGMGYALYTHDETQEERMVLEVHPHACYAALLRRRPFLKQTLEGRLQRQLVLYLEGFELRNPVTILEETTRHHLLSGHLPLEGLYEHDELDALVAAYTAYLVGVKPARVCQVGDREEGMITLPAAKLEDFYP